MDALAMARDRTQPTVRIQRGEPVAPLNVLIPVTLRDRLKQRALDRRKSLTQLVTDELSSALERDNKENSR